jgi:hypothetical protein
VPTEHTLVSSVDLAGAGNDLAVGRRCASRDDVVQGLDPSTGAVRWAVRATGDLGIFLSPPGSDVLVAAVQAGAGSVTESWSVPGPPVSARQITTFDMNTGRPIWQESGVSTGATADGDATTVCVTDESGYECRQIATGALTVGAPAPESVGPYGDSGPVTQAGGFVYQLQTDHLVVRSASTGAITATEPLSIGRTAANGGATTNGLIAAGDGLVLIRRADVDGSPVLAMTG